MHSTCQGLLIPPGVLSATVPSHPPPAVPTRPPCDKGGYTFPAQGFGEGTKGGHPLSLSRLHGALAVSCRTRLHTSTGHPGGVPHIPQGACPGGRATGISAIYASANPTRALLLRPPEYVQAEEEYEEDTPPPCHRLASVAGCSGTSRGSVLHFTCPHLQNIDKEKQLRKR